MMAVPDSGTAIFFFQKCISNKFEVYLEIAKSTIELIAETDEYSKCPHLQFDKKTEQGRFI